MMICSLMLFIGMFKTAEESMDKFDETAEGARAKLPR